MGWGIGPISHGDSINDIIARLAERYPNEKTGSVRSWAAQIRRFNRDMKEGDGVATVSTHQAQGRLCHIGIIRNRLFSFGPSRLFDQSYIDYIHRVEWLHQVSPDTLPEYTRKRLGIPLILHRLSAEASAELRENCS
jgi:restriction system protein